MSNKMQAAVVRGLGKPLVLEEWDIPTPGPSQILVKTEGPTVKVGGSHALGLDVAAAPESMSVKPTAFWGVADCLMPLKAPPLPRWHVAKSLEPSQ